MDNIGLELPSFFDEGTRWECMRRAGDALDVCAAAARAGNALIPCRNVDSELLLKSVRDEKRDMLREHLDSLTCGTRVQCAACDDECWLPPEHADKVGLLVCWMCVGVMSMIKKPALTLALIEVMPNVN